MTNKHCIGQHFNSFVEKNLSCFLCDKVLQYKFYIDAFLKKIHVCPIYITLLVVSVHKNISLETVDIQFMQQMPILFLVTMNCYDYVLQIYIFC